MPKIDPITGCTVMTLPEFWNAEAEGTGKTGAEVAADFHAEEAKAREEEGKHLRDPKVLLPMLKKECKEWNEADPEAGTVPIPTSIVEVLSLNISDSFRSSGFSTTCRVRCRKGGKTIKGLLRVESFHYSGSFYEPPDWDGNITFTEEK